MNENSTVSTSSTFESLQIKSLVQNLSSPNLLLSCKSHLSLLKSDQASKLFAVHLNRVNSWKLFAKVVNSHTDIIVIEWLQELLDNESVRGDIPSDLPYEIVESGLIFKIFLILEEYDLCIDALLNIKPELLNRALLQLDVSNYRDIAPFTAKHTTKQHNTERLVHLIKHVSNRDLVKTLVKGTFSTQVPYDEKWSNSIIVLLIPYSDIPTHIAENSVISEIKHPSDEFVLKRAMEYVLETDYMLSAFMHEEKFGFVQREGEKVLETVLDRIKAYSETLKEVGRTEFEDGATALKLRTAQLENKVEELEETLVLERQEFEEERNRMETRIKELVSSRVTA